MSLPDRLGVASSSIVLDIGFRSSDELVTISKLVGESGLVYGGEPDESLVANVVQQVKEMLNIRPIVGNVYNVPLDDNSVDIFIFNGVLHEVGNPVKALKEARKVCRSGGRVLIVDFSEFPWRWNFSAKSPMAVSSSKEAPGRIFGQASRILG